MQCSTLQKAGRAGRGGQDGEAEPQAGEAGKARLARRGEAGGNTGLLQVATALSLLSGRVVSGSVVCQQG